MILRYTLAWVPMVFIAIINGALRQTTYGKFVTELHAHQISTATGVFLFGIYMAALTRRWRIESLRKALAIGAVWLFLTVAFEFVFGRFILGRSWEKLFSDYNLLAGRVWVLVLVWIAIAPCVFYALYGNKQRPMPVHGTATPFRENRLLRFCIVGTLGFLIDTGVLYALVWGAGMDRYSARLVSFFTSASATWVLNRNFTFAAGLKERPKHREWAIYIALMVGGGAVNYGVYALCIFYSEIMYAHPVIAVAAGALAGLAINFSTSRRLFLGRPGILSS